MDRINKIMFLTVAQPQRGSLSTTCMSWSSLEFRKGGFLVEGKPEDPANNISMQGREPTTNSTYI